MYTAEEIRDKTRAYTLTTWSKQGNRNPIVIEKSEGIYYWDKEGKRYTTCRRSSSI